MLNCCVSASQVGGKRLLVAEDVFPLCDRVSPGDSASKPDEPPPLGRYQMTQEKWI